MKIIFDSEVEKERAIGVIARCWICPGNIGLKDIEECASRNCAILAKCPECWKQALEALGDVVEVKQG